jgi:hypothetical protein
MVCDFWQHACHYLWLGPGSIVGDRWKLGSSLVDVPFMESAVGRARASGWGFQHILDAMAVTRVRSAPFRANLVDNGDDPDYDDSRHHVGESRCGGVRGPTA